MAARNTRTTKPAEDEAPEVEVEEQGGAESLAGDVTPASDATDSAISPVADRVSTPDGADTLGSTDDNPPSFDDVERDNGGELDPEADAYKSLIEKHGTKPVGESDLEYDDVLAVGYVPSASKENALRLLELATELGYDADTIRVVDGGFEAPASVVEKYQSDRETAAGEED